MQYLGSVQNLDISLSSWLPIGLSPRTMQYLGSVQNLDILLKFGGISPSVKVWDVDLTLEAPRTVRATDTSKRSP